ncbi:SDR family NAD(P)-dependent oxidoreductase, partial [Klebsiella pneumoniae]|uniref:SDR family NAD(P)-dependent oxidoreductase n=2 Tax=Bacteria TaxID=2 RepID=UPI00273202D8
MDIAGTTALVTGAASGLGLATVTAFAKAGARVVALDLPTANTEALDALGDAVQFVPA